MKVLWIVNKRCDGLYQQLSANASASMQKPKDKSDYEKMTGIILGM